LIVKKKVIVKITGSRLLNILKPHHIFFFLTCFFLYYYSNQQSQYIVTIAIYTKWGGQAKKKIKIKISSY